MTATSHRKRRNTPDLQDVTIERCNPSLEPKTPSLGAWRGAQALSGLVHTADLEKSYIELVKK